MTSYKCTGCDNHCIFSAPIKIRDPWLCPLKGITVKWEDHVEDYARHDTGQTIIASETIRYDVEQLIEKYSGDTINHPNHYAHGRKYEPIDVIEDWQLGFHLGNTVKYIARAGRKDDMVQDLEKARWYLDRKIQSIKEGE